MIALTRRAVSRGLAVAALAAVAACNGDQAPPPPVALVAVGDFQFTGTVAERLPSTLTVRVNDAQGSPVNGVPITFTVAEGGGSLTKLVDTTRSGGLATTNWTLGERAGTQRITASATGLTSIDFTATARAGAPSTIAANGGTGQSVVVGSAALTPPAVIVKDRFTNPVPGVSVVFTVASGGGTIVGNAATTNSAGIAAVTSWTMGTTVGANTLTALALSGGITGNPVTFSATATPGAVATIAALGSTSLTSTVFTAVTPVPQVKVTDASGNAVPNVTVTFTTSGGTVVAGTTSASSVTRTSNASGIASPDGWVLGTAAGSYTLTASATGATSAVFTAAARAGAPATMTKVGGDAQSALAGRTVETEPSVRVVDIHGNPVAGVDVLFEVATGGGTAVGRRTITNALGIATVGGWTLGDAVGSNTLVASVPSSSVTAVTFTATGTAGAASTMVGNGGQNQTAAAGTAVTTAPSVVVRDARGNPVAGVAVTFSVGSGGGTVVGGSATTNASGIATVTSWTLGGSVGTQTLVARSTGLPEVTFSATATAGAAARLTSWSVQEQTGITAGATLTVSQRPAVRVTDAVGNPVSGVAVVFRVAQDGSMGLLGATAADTVATANSNVNGIATVPAWVMPAAVGAATLVASTSGLAETVTFRVTTTAGAAANMTALFATSIGPVTIGGTVADGSLPSVRLTDANNNPVVGATVTFTAGGFGTITGGSATTNMNGVAKVASWSASTTTLGEATVTASFGLLTAIPFTATVVANAAQSTVTTAAASVNQGLTTTVTVTLRNTAGATITTATGAGTLFFPTPVVAATAGTAGLLGAFACTGGVCTATYTAPAATGISTVSVFIGGVAAGGSPVTMVTP